MNIVNLTSHDMTIINRDGSSTCYPPSGTVARVREQRIPMSSQVPRQFQVRLGDVYGLPAPQQGTVLLVGMPVAMALLASGELRGDVAYPAYQVVKDRRVVAAQGLAFLANASRAESGYGWDPDGYARITGVYRIDAAIERLQGATNCSYPPVRTLERLDIDVAAGDPVEQFGRGRIQFRDGSVVELGGALGLVWGCILLPSVSVS
jgi:hypothetical protein